MGNCPSQFCAKSVPGTHRNLPYVDWDADDHFQQLEINGVPVHHFLRTVCSLPLQQAQAVAERIDDELNASDITLASPCAAGVRSSTVPVIKGLCNERTARIEVCCWNVGSLADSRSCRGAGIEDAARREAKKVLSKALGVGRGDGADVIVVGLQEVISLTVDNAMAGAPRSSLDYALHCGWPETVVQWVELLKESINGTGEDAGSGAGRRDGPGTQLYVIYGQPIYLFGMLLCVFCLPELVGTAIHQFSIFEMPADIVGSGVKGVVACRFALYDQSFCFLNCHLHADTAHTEEGMRRDFEERLNQLHLCCNRIEFRLNDQFLYPLWAHRSVFLMGDTNMRLSKPARFETPADFHRHVLEVLRSGKYSQLWKYDQLTKLLKHPIGSLAKGSKRTDQHTLTWREPTAPGEGPPFAPTFKLNVPGPGYSQKRAPAWTDRILYRSPVVTPIQYDAVVQEDILDMRANAADHNPVYGLFEVTCIQVDKVALHAHVQELLFEHSGKEPCPRDAFQQLRREQRRHFKWRFVHTGRPHIEMMAQRLFNSMQSELNDRQLAKAADWIIEAQQECWRIVCENLERELLRSLRDGHDRSESGGEATLLHRRLQSMAVGFENSFPANTSKSTFGPTSETEGFVNRTQIDLGHNVVDSLCKAEGFVNGLRTNSSTNMLESPFTDKRAVLPVANRRRRPSETTDRLRMGAGNPSFVPCSNPQTAKRDRGHFSLKSWILWFCNCSK